jgi:very-short-patch-repair endonuclease
MLSSREFARYLRKNQTSSEKLLWRKLRDRRLHDAKFRRQVAINPYVVDFLCVEKKLIIEVDGTSHDERKMYDAIREEYLKSKGFRILRFRNSAVNHSMNGVLEIIAEALKPPHPNPLPEGEGNYYGFKKYEASLSPWERAGVRIK